ncbi:hypothetical protein BDV29DRAFT_178154, partial [Aspergillus leporis]
MGESMRIFRLALTSLLRLYDPFFRSPIRRDEICNVDLAGLKSDGCLMHVTYMYVLYHIPVPTSFSDFRQQPH